MWEGTLDTIRHISFLQEPGSLENSVLAKASLNNHLSTPDLRWDGGMSCAGSAPGVGKQMSAPVHICSHTIKSWAGGL